MEESTMRTITVQLERDDLPEMWEAILFTIDNKYPDYKNGDVEFWELPNHGHGSYFEEPDDTDCTVNGYHPISYVKLPTLKITAENADIASDEGEGCYVGYLISISTDWISKDCKTDYYALIAEYNNLHNRLSGFKFVDTAKVEHPKIDKTC